MSVILLQSSVKPAMWMCDPGIIAHNYAQMGLPMSVFDIPMWEGAGIAFDYSGHGNYGTLESGASWVRSKFGSAIRFDGSNDYIDCRTAPATDLGAAITLSVWIKRSGDGSSDYPAIITKRVDANNAYSLRYRPSLNRAELFIGYGDGYKIVGTNGDLDIGTWYHLMGTWDGTTLLLYLNGILQTNTDTTPLNTADTSGATLWIGKFDTGTIYPFEGNIGQISIFKQALNLNQAQQLYINLCSMYEPIRSPAIWTSLVGGLSIPIAMHHYNQLRLG